VGKEHDSHKGETYEDEFAWYLRPDGEEEHDLTDREHRSRRDARWASPNPKTKKLSWAISMLAGGDVIAWNTFRRDCPSIAPNLQDRSFNGMNLKGVNLTKARLDGSHFIGADLTEARFDGSMLRHANFGSANLTKARFMRALVANATFDGANLHRTNFHGALGLKDDQLAQASSAKTIVRDGVRDLPSVSPPIFISYSHADEEPVLAVDQWLRSRGARIILDDRNFILGKTIRDEILEWMGKAGIIVAFVSQSSRDRPYAKLEREIANTLHDRGEKRLIYFNLDDTVLDVVQEGRLYVPGHRLGFEEACDRLWTGINEQVRTALKVDLSPFRDAGTGWAQIRDVGSQH
jgi:hypothetical protein